MTTFEQRYTLADLWEPYRFSEHSSPTPTESQIVTLLALRQGDRHTIEIARAGVGDAPRVLLRLRRAGLVVRLEGRRDGVPQPHARLRSFYRLTPKGRELADALVRTLGRLR